MSKIVALATAAAFALTGAAWASEAPKKDAAKEPAKKEEKKEEKKGEKK